MISVASAFLLFSSVAILTFEKEDEEHNFVAGSGLLVIRFIEDVTDNWWVTVNLLIFSTVEAWILKNTFSFRKLYGENLSIIK